jgi:acetoacetyl-CoA synthetase
LINGDVLSGAVVREGDFLWTPSASWIADTNLTAFTAWLARERGRTFEQYADLWEWSVSSV